LTPYSREGFLEPIYELIESVHGPFEMTYKCYNQLKARDKTSLDVFWLRDKSLTDLDNLPEPDELAEEIIENLEVGLDSFREVLAGLNKVACRQRLIKRWHRR